MQPRALILAASFFASGAPAIADPLHVPSEFPTIQSAIDAAKDGDTVLVAAGVYLEAIDLLGKQIVVQAEVPPTSIIDATGLGTSAITCTSGETLETIIAGFTVRGGSAPIGGGIRIGSKSLSPSSATVRQCVITANESPQGAGFYITGSFDPGGAAVIEQCIVEENIGDGALLHFHPDATFRECIFRANTNNSIKTGVGAFGTAFFERCHFEGNAGEIALRDLYFVAMESCTVVGNDLDGIGVYDSWAYIGNSIIAANGRSGMNMSYGRARLQNCILIDNRDAAVNGWSSSVRVWNSILRGNGEPVFDHDGSLFVDAEFSIIQGGWPGAGNLDVDPLFADPASGDYALLPGSPAIGAGHNWLTPRDWIDIDGDGSTGELVPLDFAGKPRIRGGRSAQGCGGPPTIDIGPFEQQSGDSGAVLWGDVNEDAVVNVNDLVQVIASWGRCDSTCCMSDVLRDGVIDRNDLVVVLGQWTAPRADP